MAAEICSHGQVYINLGNVFAECVHFVCLRSMLAAKMSIIQTRNYILKWVNSSVTLSVLFSILPKWYVIKTKHTCMFGESGIGRTSGGWKFPEPTSLRSVGSVNFQPPSVRPIPDSPPCKYVCYRTHLPFVELTRETAYITITITMADII